VNHLLDAGRSIRFGKRTRFASTPMICVTAAGKTQTRLLTNLKREDEDERGEEPQSYPDSIADEAVTITLSPPSMVARYEIEGVRVARTTISPELSGNEDDVSVPATVDLFELANPTGEERTVTLVLPRPSLVNLTEKKLRAEQDNAFAGQGATEEQVHEEFQSASARGVVMGSKKTGDRMAIAVAKVDGLALDVQPSFRTAAYKTDLLVDAQGKFAAHKSPEPTFECGAAIAVTVKLPAGGSAKVPFVTVMDFAKQKYVDGKAFDRGLHQALHRREDPRRGHDRVGFGRARKLDRPDLRHSISRVRHRSRRSRLRQRPSGRQQSGQSALERALLSLVQCRLLDGRSRWEP